MEFEKELLEGLRTTLSHRETVPHFAPSLGGPSDEAVRLAYEVLEKRKEAVKAQQAGTLVQCVGQVANGKGCGKLTPISELVYIQDHWYTQPHGCSGGDYWNLGEGGFICPGCGKHNRLYCSPEVEKMKPNFKEVINAYDGKIEKKRDFDLY